MPDRSVQTDIMHRVVVHGNTIYLGGMVADDKSLSIGGQTLQALKKIDELLKTVGSDATSLLSVTAYIVDMSTKKEMNEAWKSFFAPETLPARATVGVAELGPGTLIELSVVAAVKG